MAPAGRKPKRIALPRLRETRQARSWTEDDLAAAVLDVAEDLDEPEPRVTGSHVSKWERGDRKPGPYYRARLCLALDSTPEQLGFLATPTLVRSIRGLMQRRQQSQHATETARQGSQDQVDEERLRATLAHLWPVDRPLLDGLNRVARQLAHRRDTEHPRAVMSDLGAQLDMLLELLARSQRPDHGRQLRRIAAFVGQNLAMAQWIAGDAPGTYRTYATAESLARESRSGSELALILVDRSEMAGQLARRGGGEWEEAHALADAAEAAALMDPETPPGVLAWIYGERSGHRAEMGDELGSGRDLERMDEVSLTSPPEALNLFSPSVGGNWTDNYHVRRALRLGRSDDAIRICTRTVSETDPRLIWQHAETLLLLAEAWLLKGELGGAREQLGKAIPLLKSTGNVRDLRGAHRVMNQMRRRWGRESELRELDEALRA